MRFIAYNVVAILLIALAAYLIYLNRGGWGWCIFAALLVTVFPGGTNKKKTHYEN